VVAYDVGVPSVPPRLAPRDGGGASFATVHGDRRLTAAARP
jgi:hypothetical protein